MRTILHLVGEEGWDLNGNTFRAITPFDVITTLGVNTLCTINSLWAAGHKKGWGGGR